TLPTQKKLTAAFGRCRPISSMSAAVTSGNSGISQRCSRKYPEGFMAAASGISNSWPSPSKMERASPFQKVHFVFKHRFAITEESDDDAQSHRGFRGRVRDNEQRKNLPGNVAKNPREGHQVDVHGVQNQLDGHQHHDHVAPRNHADG